MEKDKQNTAQQNQLESKEKTMEQLREEHPFESDSQIQNRYGEGREKSGSDGTHQDARGSNH